MEKDYKGREEPVARTRGRRKRKLLRNSEGKGEDERCGKGCSSGCGSPVSCLSPSLPTPPGTLAHGRLHGDLSRTIAPAPLHQELSTRTIN